MLFDLKTSGKITYNGHGLNEFVAPRTAAYVSQQDQHIAEMTVRETLEFAGQCQGVGFKYGEELQTLPQLIHIFFEVDQSNSSMWKSKSLFSHFFHCHHNDAGHMLGLDMLLELARREKIGGIKPDEDLDLFMKVSAILHRYQ